MNETYLLLSGACRNACAYLERHALYTHCIRECKR